jgi:ATP-binding cassette subfamily F protein uup
LLLSDEGKLKIKNGIKISYLEQTPPQDNHKNLFDIVAEGLGDIGKILSQYQLVGSSSSKIFGSCIKAFANITRLRQPPDKVDKIAFPYSLRLNFRSILGQVKLELKRKLMFAIDFSVKRTTSRN